MVVASGDIGNVVTAQTHGGIIGSQESGEARIVRNVTLAACLDQHGGMHIWSFAGNVCVTFVTEPIFLGSEQHTPAGLRARNGSHTVALATLEPLVRHMHGLA